MNFPDNLKDLHKLCQENSLKFKGKTKAQLKKMLSELVTQETSDKEDFTDEEDLTEEDLTALNVKELKTKCEALGLSKYGTKAELQWCEGC